MKVLPVIVWHYKTRDFVVELLTHELNFNILITAENVIY